MRGIWPTVASLALAGMTSFLLFGCGGAQAGVAGVGGPACTTVSGAQFSIKYPARSAGVPAFNIGTTDTNLSSALSAKIVVPAGAADGTDLTININRNASDITAHTETYDIPTIKTGTYNVTITAYSLPNQAGVVVGTASVTETLTCSSATPLNFAFTNVVKSVVVAPATFTMGGASQELTFTAMDASNAVVPVTSGSAIFSIANGNSITLTAAGLAAPIAVGVTNVTALVDGVVSPPAAVTVNPAPAYKIVDMGANTQFPSGNTINDTGQVLVQIASGQTLNYQLQDGGTGTVLGNIGTNAVGEFGLNNAYIVGSGPESGLYWSLPSLPEFFFYNSGSPRAINRNSNVVGVSIGNGPSIYWDSPTGFTSNSLATLNNDGVTNVIPAGINNSKLIVGTTKFGAGGAAAYLSAPSATQALVLPTFAGTVDYSLANGVNDSGVIVGEIVQAGVGHAVMWSSVSSNPTDLGAVSTTPTFVVANAVNNSGVVVGYDLAATPQTAFVYKSVGGMQNLFNLCDSTRTGWTLTSCQSINSNGWILGQGTLNGSNHAFVAIPLGP